MQKTIKKRSVFKFLLIVIITVFILSAVYLFLGREKIELNDTIRKKLGGTYITLKSGITHYSQEGLENSQTVIFIHGSTISMWDFNLQKKSLLKNGYRVILYDALGRGYSDRPDVEYTRKLYKLQLKQLIDKLNIKKKIVLAGHSLGGATAVSFASSYPNRIAGLFLISPVINSVTTAAPFIICNTPFLGRLIYRAGMAQVLENRSIAQWNNNVPNPQYYNNLFKKQMEIKGFEHAVCSMFQTDLVGDYIKNYIAVDRLNIPFTIVYGENDSVIGLDKITLLKRKTSNIIFKKIKNAGHCAHVEQKKTIDQLLLMFLKKIR